MILINPTDTAKYAPKTTPLRYAPLVGLSEPPRHGRSYLWVRNRHEKLLGYDENPCKVPLSKQIEAYEQRGADSENTVANAATARALIDFQNLMNIEGRSLTDFGIRGVQVGPVKDFKCWSNGLFFVQDKPTVFFFDARTSSSKLDDDGISFVHSALHHLIRCRHYELHDVECAVLQIKIVIRDNGDTGEKIEVRRVEPVYLHEEPRYTRAELDDLMDSLYQDFYEVLKEKRRAG